MKRDFGRCLECGMMRVFWWRATAGPARSIMMYTLVCSQARGIDFPHDVSDNELEELDMSYYGGAMVDYQRNDYPDSRGNCRCPVTDVLNVLREL